MWIFLDILFIYFSTQNEKEGGQPNEKDLCDAKKLLQANRQTVLICWGHFFVSFSKRLTFIVIAKDKKSCLVSFFVIYVEQLVEF